MDSSQSKRLYSDWVNFYIQQEFSTNIFQQFLSNTAAIFYPAAPAHRALPDCPCGQSAMLKAIILSITCDEAESKFHTKDRQERTTCQSDVFCFTAQHTWTCPVTVSVDWGQVAGNHLTDTTDGDGPCGVSTRVWPEKHLRRERGQTAPGDTLQGGWHPTKIYSCGWIKWFFFSKFSHKK